MATKGRHSQHSRRGRRGRGGGRASYVEAPREFTGTSNQVCGLWPWSTGSTSPTIGVPCGPHINGETTVCFDCISWFTDARLLSNPSVFVLGLPGLGKSTFVRRQLLGLVGCGVTPLVLGDLKPDYADLVRAIGGQVVTYGRGAGSLNMLSAGALDAAADTADAGATQAATQARKSQLTMAATRLRHEAHDRRVNAVAAQFALIRGERLEDYEQVVLSAALRELAKVWRRRKTEPVMKDLHAMIEAGPDEVRRVTGWRGEENRYRAATDKLQATFLAWMESPLGEVFGSQTTTPLRLDAVAVCIDVSRISRTDIVLQAAALLACWGEGFGQVNAANELADLGLAPQRRFFVILDELWRPLSAGVPGIVDAMNALTRLNRTDGCGVAMVTHSLADMRAIRDPADQAKAAGFVERAGAVVCGGLPLKEVAELALIVPFTDAERDLITGWATPAGWDPAESPPGQGNLLIKVGQRPGIPFHLQLTQAELDANVHDTNKRWAA